MVHIPRPSVYPEEMETGRQREMCTPQMHSAFLATAETEGQPECPAAEGRVEETCCVRTVGYCSTVRREETLPLVPMSMRWTAS